MRSVTALSLSVTSVLFLTACDPKPECAWAEPIVFQQETKEWLEGEDWPDTAYADFDQIGDHNELHDRFCD